MALSMLLVSSVLSSLIAAGFSLSCTNCAGAGNTCIGRSVRCSSSDDVCITLYTIASLGDLGEHAVIVRDCGKRSMCSKLFSYSSINTKSRNAISCCSSDDCTPQLPVVPPESSKRNGVSCKSCLATSNKPCETNTFIDCVGNETMCISMVSSVEGPSTTLSTALRGCATKAMCELSQEIPIGQLKSKTSSTCTSGGHAFHSNWMLLLVSFSLLLKFT